jgi:hypothetical protein
MAGRSRKHAKAIDPLFDLKQIDGNKRKRVVLRAEPAVPVSVRFGRPWRVNHTSNAKTDYSTADQEVTAALKDTQFLYTFTHDLKHEIGKLSDSPGPVEEELPELINNIDEDLEDAVLHHSRSGKVSTCCLIPVIKSQTST